MSKKRIYAAPLTIGLLGMFICHVIILLAFGAGMQYPIYLLTYPIIYPALAVLLSLKSPKLWISDAILINAFPLAYWYVLLWSVGKLSISDASKFQDSAGMLLIMPLTLALTLLASFITSGIRKTIPSRTDMAGNRQVK